MTMHVSNEVVTEKAFCTWTEAGVRYIAFPNHGNVSVVDEYGNNHGAWMTVEAFRRRDREAFKSPVGKCALSFVIREGK
jgi:hypothetical protein